MSFWNAIKATGAAAVAAASEGVAAAQKAVTDLRSPPTSIMCAGCQHQVPVPPALWEWKCEKADCAKTNGGSAAACVDCKTSKPKNLPNPKVTCGKCQTTAVVPWSTAGRLLDDAKTVVVHTAASAKKEFEMLQEKPTQFNCEHCQTLLGVPAPQPWSCAQCKATNPADSAACAGCSAAKPLTANMVLCGECHKPTKVPSNNFLVKVAHEYHSAEKTLKKLYLDISAKPYILCPRCQTPLHVDLKQQKQQPKAAGAAPAPASSAAAAPAPAASASGAADAKAAGGEAVGGKASAGQSAPNVNAVPENDGVEVVCTKCSEKLLVAVGAGGAAAGGAGGAAAPAPAPAN